MESFLGTACQHTIGREVGGCTLCVLHFGAMSDNFVTWFFFQNWCQWQEEIAGIPFWRWWKTIRYLCHLIRLLGSAWMLATIYILLLHPHCNSRRKVGFFVLLLDCCSGKRGDKSTLVILSPLLPSLFYSIFCHFKLTTTQYFVFHHITGSWKAKRSEREPHQLKIRKCFLESWQQVIIHFDSAHFYELIKWASSHCFMFLAIPNKNHPKLRKTPMASN